MTRYDITIASELLQTRNRNTKLFLHLGLIFLFMAVIFLFLLLYVGVSKRYTGTDYYIGVISVSGAITALFALFIASISASYYINKKKWKYWPLSLEINNDGLSTISVDGNKETFVHTFFDDALVEVYLSFKKIKSQT